MYDYSQTDSISGGGEAAGLAVEPEGSGPSYPSPGEPLYQHANVTAMHRRETMLRLVLTDPEEELVFPLKAMEGDSILNGFWILTQRAPRPMVGTFIHMERFVSLIAFDEDAS